MLVVITLFHDRNHNRVQDRGEEVLPNVDVEILYRDGRSFGRQRTNSEGEVYFENVPPGWYDLYIDWRDVFPYTWSPWREIGIASWPEVQRFYIGFALPPTATPTPQPNDIIARDLEITQGIQDLDNSVRLVAEKLTLVRFYVSERGPRSREPVTAKLIIQKGRRRVEVEPVRRTRRLRLSNDAWAGRDDPYGTFLFIVPYEFTVSSWLSGNEVTFTAVVNPDREVEETRYDNNSITRRVRFEPVPPLNVHLIRVQYRHRRNDLGISGTVPPPSLDHRTALYYWLIAAYPVSQVNMIDSVYNWNQTFVTNPGGSVTPDPETITIRLNTLLESAFAASDARRDLPGAPVRRYGMVWDGFGDGDNLGLFIRGRCCAGRTGSGPTGLSISGAFPWDTDGSWGDWYAGHEIGHSFGRGHVRCRGDEDGPDPRYPWPNGGIGNGSQRHLYGYHIYRGEVYPGRSWNDVMTYCNNQWISDYTYEGIMTAIQREARRARSRAQQARTDRLVVTGSIDPRDNSVTLQPMFVIPNALAEREPQPGPYAIVLRAADGRELARYPFTPQTSVPGPAPQGTSNPVQETVYLTFSEQVPYVAGTDWVDIEGPEGVVLKTVRAGSAAPIVNITSPAAGTTFTGDTLRVAWIASDPDGDPLYALVQYSADNGQTWMSVGFPTDEAFIDVPATNVRNSDQGRFRVLVSDGIHTTVAEVGPIIVPNRPPTLDLLAPENNSVFLKGQTITFRAFAYDDDVGTLSNSQITWRSDRDGLLGYGQTLTTASLSEGTHVITARADDGSGGVVEKQVTVEVVADPELLPPLPNALKILPRQVFLDVPRERPITTLLVDNLNVDGSVEWRASADKPWILLEEEQGTTPQEVGLIVDTLQLTPGTHTGYITFEQPSTGEKIQVEVTVLLRPNRTYLPTVAR